MSGILLPSDGEVCPSVLPAPFELGADITSNGVCCASYRNPPEQLHQCRFLPGQVPEASPCFPCVNKLRLVSICWLPSR